VGGRGAADQDACRSRVVVSATVSWPAQITVTPTRAELLVAGPARLSRARVRHRRHRLVHIGQAVMGCAHHRLLVDAVFNYPTLAEAYKSPRLTR